MSNFRIFTFKLSNYQFRNLEVNNLKLAEKKKKSPYTKRIVNAIPHDTNYKANLN